MKYYIYQLICPITDDIFYVGKGSNGRVSQHVKDAKCGKIKNKNKHIRIMSIINAGHQVIERIISYYGNEDDAFKAERLMIDDIGLESLTNINPGGDGGSSGLSCADNGTVIDRLRKSLYEDKSIEEVISAWYIKYWIVNKKIPSDIIFNAAKTFYAGVREAVRMHDAGIKYNDKQYVRAMDYAKSIKIKLFPESFSLELTYE